MRSALRAIRRLSSSLRSRRSVSYAPAQVVIAALIAIATLMLPGCERNSPHGIARRYLENLQRSNYSGCYAMLADRDRKNRTLAEFLTEIPLAPDVGPAVFRPVLQKIQFELGDVRIDGYSAVVALKVAAPDLPLWERTLDAVAGSDHFGGQNAEPSLASGDFPKGTYDDELFLTRERHRWHVVAGFTDRDRIVDLHREAIVEYHQFQYAKVIADYESMLAELDKLKFTGARGLAARYRAELAGVRAAQADVPAATAYAAKSLTLGDIAMSMSEERVPAIFGSIANTGARALDAVQIAVTWYQGRGKDLKVVYAEKHPIVTTPIEFTDFSVPVIPFVPNEKRQFGFILTAPVQVQQDAAPYVTVSAITFTYLKAPLPKLARAQATGSPAASTPSSASPPGVSIDKPAAPPLPNSGPTPPPSQSPAKKMEPAEETAP
jgi:hypothetical protein